MTDIVYPTGCRPLSEDLGTDELIRRLKTLANALQTMGQNDVNYEQYIPLSLHLVDDFFISHNSRDVQLLIACCIADTLRIFAPEPPYKDQEQIEAMFMFLIRQLYGLKDPKDPAFKRYFYLLESLAYVKSFNMCFEVEDCQKILSQLFAMMFKIINEDHSVKVKHFMIDILSPLITEADNFTTELLDMILINIVEPNKSQNKYAYQLAVQLILKTSDSLEPIIKMFFNQVLVMDRLDKNLSISSKIYDLIYELNHINPTILTSILPQLDCKLRATNESERLRAVSVLGRMFSEKNSQLWKKHSSLFRIFISRFCDIAVNVRIKCVQSSMHFLLNHPYIREDIIDCLKARQHDCEEQARYEVVISIVETAKRDFTIVCESEDLLNIIRERSLDKKYKIRKEAMNGLAYIYKRALCEPNDLSEETKQSISWIKNKILHLYYMASIEDRLLVERLLITCLVPYKLSSEERMKKLYHLLGTLDENASKAFIELQKNQMKSRKTVSDWIKLHHSKEITSKLQNQLNLKQNVICKLLPDPVKANEFLTIFSQNLRKDPLLLKYMEIILKRDVSCKECADTMSALLKKLGNPIMTNLYYHTVKMLIERIASVMVDKEAIGILIGLIENCMEQGDAIKEIGLPTADAGKRGLQLLSMLAYVFSAHFFRDSTMRHMVSLLSYDLEYAAPLLLKCFTHLGRFKPLSEAFPAIFSKLVTICKEFAVCGTEKQAKHAVRCIFVNSQTSLPTTNTSAGGGGTADINSNSEPFIHPIFNEIMDVLRVTLVPNCENQRMKIITLGHIAFNMPKAFTTQVKNMIARRIVKDLLIQGVPETRNCKLPIGDWCDEDELPSDTLCKLQALKTMARWLLGLKDDEHAAQKTFRMLSAFIAQSGDLLEQNRLCVAEKSWLRLGAACAMLKVCEQKGVGDQYSAEQYFILSQLMCDPVLEVRKRFTEKLHKGLGVGLPSKCLPLDFMGFYALAGHETDKKLSDKIRQYVESDVNRRREYLKTVSNSSDSLFDGQTMHLYPDFMLAFAIPIIVHHPSYKDYEDRNQLKKVEKCLRFIIDPLMAKRDAFSYSFYTNLIEKMKNHYDATLNADDNSMNSKMWAACDLALYIINSKIRQCDLSTTTSVGVGFNKAGNKNNFSIPIKLPTMYYKPCDFVNTKIYLPDDMYSMSMKPITKKGTGTTATKSIINAESSSNITNSTSTTSTTTNLNQKRLLNNPMKVNSSNKEQNNANKSKSRLTTDPLTSMSDNDDDNDNEYSTANSENSSPLHDKDMSNDSFDITDDDIEDDEDGEDYDEISEPVLKRARLRGAKS